MSEAIPQPEARRLQFAAITGGGQEPAASFVELRFREPGGPMRRTFFGCRALADASATAALLTEDRDVYVNTAPLIYRFGGADAVERKWVLAIDLDRRDALERLAAYTPQPSIIVATGTDGRARLVAAATRAACCPRTPSSPSGGSPTV